MAWMCPLDVVARAAVVPDQPAGVRSDAPGGAHEDRGVRAEQDITPGRYIGQQRLERAPVAVVVFHAHDCGPVQGLPRFKPESRLPAELREPSRQGQASSDAQPVSHGLSPHIDLEAERTPIAAGKSQRFASLLVRSCTSPPCPPWDAWNTLVGQFASRAGRPPRRDYGVAPYLRAAGFADIRTVNLAVHLPVASPQTCWDFHMSHGFAALVEALNPADAAEFQRHALAELTRMHESGGIMLDRGAVAYLATAPANDPSEPGSHS
jgi:hypothetical protein